MSTTFIHDDFLLGDDSAKKLFHDYAKSMPIIDYHCHLPPAEIASDHRFENMTQIWLKGDHYKWRALRAAGVDERYITGDASDFDKFETWARTVPKALRNPLYHWTHLELRRPFGITDRLLNAESARGIWDDCNAKLSQPEFSTRGILKQMNVEVVCTTDDPIDDLEHHKALLADASSSLKMYPAFRPDKALAIDDPAAFQGYLERLSASANVDIGTYSDYIAALKKRHDYFHEVGCRVSDHGLSMLDAEEYNDMKVAACFDTLRRGVRLDGGAAAEFKSAVLYELCLMNHARGWVQQFHLGVFRNTNSRMMRTLGPDTGFDSIGDYPLGRPLVHFLDRLDSDNRLAKTILYNSNPCHNEMMATVTGDFQDGTVPGKLQFGAAWWFMDQADGMKRQLDALSNMGLLSQFVGMLTDSRSFLSFTRHEYFRRILCNLLGGEIDQGLLPNDLELVGQMVRDICYNNAKRYFQFVGLS